VQKKKLLKKVLGQLGGAAAPAAPSKYAHGSYQARCPGTVPVPPHKGRSAQATCMWLSNLWFLVILGEF